MASKGYGNFEYNKMWQCLNLKSSVWTKNAQREMILQVDSLAIIVLILVFNFTDRER